MSTATTVTPPAVGEGMGAASPVHKLPLLPARPVAIASPWPSATWSECSGSSPATRSECSGSSPAALAPSSPARRLPAPPWKDPHTVAPARREEYIRALEAACLAQPRSADLRTCLGMVYAMNYDVYKSLDALEAAVRLDASHFFAQLKYAELLYRLRALPRAEQETLKAVDLANDGWELALARKQLQEVRRLMREAPRRPDWSRPFEKPVVVLGVMLFLFSMAVLWR